MVTAGVISLQGLGQLVPPRETASAKPAPRSWVLAVAVHVAIVALLLASSFTTPRPQTETPPVFEIVIPAAQPVSQPPVPQPAPGTRLPEPLTALPAPEPEPLPEPKPLIEAPAPKPFVKPRPLPPQQPVSPSNETPPADAAPAATEMPAIPAPPVAAPALSQPAVTAPQAVPPYAAILLDWLGRHRDYPRAARLRRQEGTPRIALSLDRSGRLLDLALVDASGHDLLDQAALAMARRAAPFPPPQLPAGSDTATFIVPVQFRLER